MTIILLKGILLKQRRFAKLKKSVPYYEHLHRLFTGMIISELSEAVAEGIETTEEEIERENHKFVSRLRSLLNDEIPLCEIPMRMLALDDIHSPLTRFNYQRIYYM